MYLLKALGPIYKKILRTNLGKLKCHRSASARSISCHMAPVDTQNSAIPGAITPKMTEDLCVMWPNDVQNFTPIGKAPAEKSVTVQNEKVTYSKLSMLPYTTYGWIRNRQSNSSS